MNERTAPPAEPPKPQPPQPQQPPRSPVAGRDREFLPAALEILESPPPPVPIALMATISAFALAALVWSWFGRLDVHAVAPGKVETAGYAKVIEPLDPGKVAAIHVEAGQTVKAGDLLIEFDPAEANADAAAATAALDASRAEIARRRYAIEAVRAAWAEEARAAAEAAETRPEPAKPEMTKPEPAKAEPGKPAAKAAAEKPAPAATEKPEARGPGPVEALAGRAAFPIAWDDGLPEPYRLREEAVLRADLGQLSDSLRALDHQMAQKRATRKRLEMSIAFQNNLMETLNARVATRQQAIDLNVGTKINLYDAKEELQKSQSQLASDEGQLIETDAALTELVSEKAKAVSQFIAENENKLADAARKRDEAREQRAKASARLARTKLHAPIDGVVQQTAVTTVGQVVTTGQQLAVVTPVGGTLQVEALVPNLDIGFVKVGQPAVIKIDAFPFTRFGVLHGKVVKIAPAAMTEQEAKRSLANAAASATPGQSPAAAPGQSETYVFPVTIALDETAMKIDDALIPLTPGMTVAVEIKTDSRRVLEYLLSPLAKIASEAARER